MWYIDVVDSSVILINYGLVKDGCPDGAICDDHLLTGSLLFVRHPDPGDDGDWGTPDDDYGDLRLRPNSPAIDAGDNAAVSSKVTTDLDGRPRIINGAVDMGAYETPLHVFLPLVLRAAP